MAAPQVLITPNLADQVPRQQFSFDFDVERALVSADQRAGDGAEAPDASSAAQARLLGSFVARLSLVPASVPLSSLSAPRLHDERICQRKRHRTRSRQHRRACSACLSRIFPWRILGYVGAVLVVLLRGTLAGAGHRAAQRSVHTCTV